MTQVSANTLTYDQVYLKLREYYSKEARGAFISNQQRVEEYKKLLADLQDSIGQPMTRFIPVVKGEPPSSIKFNEFSRSLVEDTNLVSKNIDYLSAKIVNAFNLFNDEIEAEKKYVERIASKAKILQMYSGAPSEDLIYLGDTFDNADQVDIAKISVGLNPHIENGILSLPISNVKVWPVREILIDSVKSNGFMGNDHQALKGSSSENSNEYTYLYKSNPAISSLSTVGDSSPITYFEYEGLMVDRSSNQNVDNTIVMEDEFSYRATKKVNPNKKENELLNWSNFNLSDQLKLTLIMKAPSSEYANNIVITPYFGSCKFIKVSSIRAITTNDNATEILTSPIYIGSSMIPTSSYMVDTYFYNRAIVKFPELKVARFEIDIEQSEYQEIDIMHSYWTVNYPTSNNNLSPFYNLGRFSTKKFDTSIYESIDYDIGKIVPDTMSPNKIKDNPNMALNLPVKVKKRQVTLSGNVVVLEVTELKKVSGNWIAYPKKDYFYMGFNDVVPSGIGTEDSLIYSDDYTDIFKQENGKYFSDIDGVMSEMGVVGGYLSGIADVDYFPEINSFYNEVLTPEELLDRTSDLQINTAVFELADNLIHLITLNPTFQVKQYVSPPQTKNYLVPIKLEHEKYSAKRKTIGIRDIEISYEKYASRAEMVSKPFDFNTEIDSIMLDVSSNVDNNLDFDLETKFYVSLSNSNWVEISPIQLSSNGIAEVLVFNKNLPINYQLPGVSYLNYPDIPKEIKNVRVKIEMSKSKNTNSTPVIYSYKLIAKVKN